jgi:hypothetical protein
VEPGDLAIEPIEPGRHSGDALPPLGGRYEDVERSVNRLANGTDGGVLRNAGDVEDSLLGLVDELLHLTDAAVAFRREALAGRDEPPDAPLLANDASVRADVRHRRNRIRQLSEIRSATHLLQPLVVA